MGSTEIVINPQSYHRTIVIPAQLDKPHKMTSISREYLYDTIYKLTIRYIYVLKS